MDERKLWFKHHQRLLLLHSVHYVYSLNDVMWRGAARRGVNGMHNLFLVKSKWEGLRFAFNHLRTVVRPDFIRFGRRKQMKGQKIKPFKTVKLFRLWHSIEHLSKLLQPKFIEVLNKLLCCITELQPLNLNFTFCWTFDSFFFVRSFSVSHFRGMLLCVIRHGDTMRYAISGIFVSSTTRFQ